VSSLKKITTLQLGLKDRETD